jgi:hypothetical protein
VSEYPRAIPDLVDLHWCDGGTPETATEPDEGLKGAGYTGNAKPAQVHWNWREREIGRLAEWLQGCVVRRFSTLAEAIAATAPGDLFTVYAPLALGAVAVTKEMPTASATVGWTTDGRRLYRILDRAGIAPRASSVVAYHAGTGALEWGSFTVVDLPAVVCTDGRYCFVLSVDAGATKIEMFAVEADTPYIAGELIDTFNVAGTWTPVAGGMAANGAHLVCLGDTGAKSGMKVIPYDSSGFGALVGTVDYTTAASCEVAACAIADTWAVMVGIDGTGAARTAMIIVDLAAATALLTLDVQSWGASGVRGFLAVATDGRRIYATGHPMDPAAGVDYRTAFAFARIPYTPEWGGGAELLWSEDRGTADGAVTLDDHHTLSRNVAVTAANVYDRADHGHELQVSCAGSTMGVVRESMDGYLLWVRAGDNLNGIQMYREPRLYRRVSGTDVNRGPLPSRLAQPVR